ncbi:hypothetical protein [Leptolyngbya ohadii]|uniref:hypothetical protein n=1 Tax=Leptolyngbya ohadii TaxID=1962290 RepID=UPI000B59ED8D|nr:hypothetical protein [Leptolyngbya ohadii]
MTLSKSVPRSVPQSASQSASRSPSRSRSIQDFQQNFQYVQELDDEFLALFPHRFDFIWAEHPDSHRSVAWKTESRHPLSDRLIRQGAYLYGVRFGAETNYCLLDIDTNSRYHPKHDPFAIARIIDTLESLGLVGSVACTSSYSGGLHLYFPFQRSQSSWQLAIGLACLLENAGFKVQPGQLEIFPNPKPYATDGNLSLFNAHRLPLQIGSYLVDQEFQPTWSDCRRFVSQWEFARQRNDVDKVTLKQILKQARRKHFAVSGRAEKFINDLNAEIELGWTGSGQTNRLLGRITMRTYIFHHVLSGSLPLSGKDLVNEIVQIAQSLPGYREWCRHQHEIEHRIEEWVRCIENSRYFRYGDQKKKEQEVQDPQLVDAIDQSPSWNQRQSAVTRDRIRKAIADLLEKNSLPVKPTARFRALLEYGIGGASLYRHRDLWHPAYFDDQDLNFGFLNSDASDSQPVENPPHPPTFIENSQLDCLVETSNWLSSTSLLDSNGSNSLPDKDSGDRSPFKRNLADSNSSEGGFVDSSVNGSSSGFADSAADTFANEFSNSEAQASVVHPVPEAQKAAAYIQQALADAQAQQEAMQEAARIAYLQREQIKSQVAQQRQIARMQEFLDSGDPILMAEAIAWAQVNPGVLKLNSVQNKQLVKDSSLEGIRLGIDTEEGQSNG